MLKKNCNILISFIFSVFICYLICGFFRNPIGCRFWNQELQKYVYSEGCSVDWREEGWGKTTYGKHGVIGMQDVVMNPSKKLVFFGDSYLEALHVSDNKKMTSQLNKLMKDAGLESIAVNIGGAGQNLADYYFQIQAYEKIIPNIKEYFIVLGGIKDLLPVSKKDMTPEEKPQIVYTNEIFFIKGNQSVELSYKDRVKRVMSKMKLQVFKLLAIEFIGSKKARKVSLLEDLDFSFSLRSSNVNQRIVADTNVKPEDFNRYVKKLIPVFKKCTTKPITFVYVPHVPKIYKGNINAIDEYTELALFFESICSENDVGFINTYDSLMSQYEIAGKLMFGFSNSYPGQGHLNSFGHEAVARSVFNSSVLKRAA